MTSIGPAVTREQSGLSKPTLWLLEEAELVENQNNTIVGLGAVKQLFQPLCI